MRCKLGRRQQETCNFHNGPISGGTDNPGVCNFAGFASHGDFGWCTQVCNDINNCNNKVETVDCKSDLNSPLRTCHYMRGVPIPDAGDASSSDAVSRDASSDVSAQ
jgi:hypothetical protein